MKQMNMRETLEEEARHEKVYEARMKEEEAHDELFRESDVDDSPINDRFKTGEGFHAVPPPYTRNYMPPRSDLSFVGLDEFVFRSNVRKTTTSVPETETSISKTSKDIVEKPKTVRPSSPIIEEWVQWYREYDLAYLKLIFEFFIYNVWKSVQYGVSNRLDTAYWGFLGVRTTFDIFQNIILIPYLEYGVLSPLDMAY
ncbi:hypothetical protein Tco_1237338 [Tanacetum coccineum]